MTGRVVVVALVVATLLEVVVRIVFLLVLIVTVFGIPVLYLGEETMGSFTTPELLPLLRRQLGQGGDDA